MGMVVELKTGEQILIGDCAVVNKHGQRVKLYIDGKLPILRQKDTLRQEDAGTPAEKLYFALQNLYLSSNSRAHYESYRLASAKLVKAVPNLRSFVEGIDKVVVSGDTYKALKEVRTLLDD